MDSRSRVRVRTSESDPLRIDEIAAGGAGGAVGITFCPGKHGDSAYGTRWERDLAADLDVIAAWKAAAVVTLVETQELTSLGVPQLGDEVRARGMEWYHLPIRDVHTPDAGFERKWETAGPRLLEHVRAGRRVLVHCRGGQGRAGTIGARLLVELGVAPADAIRQVRAVRNGAIETSEQEAYVLRLRAGGQ